MLPEVISIRRLATLVVVLASLGVSACASTTQADNAADFKDRVAASGYDIAFLSNDESRPGAVAGVVRSEDGLQIKFVFSFGPGPDKLSGELPDRGNSTWVDLGDSLEYWVESLPPGLSGARANRYVEMILAVQDIGCQVVANRPCLR